MTLPTPADLPYVSSNFYSVLFSHVSVDTVFKIYTHMLCME